MTFLLAYWKQIALALVIALWSGFMYHKGAASVQAKFDKHLAVDAIAAQQASEAARKHEQQDAANSARIAQAYEQGKADAEAAARHVVDDLRAGNLRLRRMWSGCQARSVPDAPAAPGEPDATAADRNESASRIVRAAREADEQIKGLQDLLRAERNAR